MSDPLQAGLFSGGQTPSSAMIAKIEEVNTRAARTAATHERWIPTRLIVHNYWLYSYQEFHFADGKLVLRGQNGAGKSTVLASAMPTVIDGDKSPARMDTFGTRSKTIADYLVGPKEATPSDPRYYPDRTGYIALEFRRGITSPQYRTIGMGVRAERKTELGQPRITSWYFVVSDGRRCGREHSIQFSRNEAGQEIMRSMGDLERELGPVNLVTDNQGDYQIEVNNRLFGFPDPGDLRSLTQLLVTLRTPKLDKTITPEKACDMLTDALPPLNPALLERMTALIDDIENTQRRVAETEDHLAKATAMNREQASIYRLQAHLAAVTLLETIKGRDDAQLALIRTHEELNHNRQRQEGVEREISRLKKEEDAARGTLRFIRNHQLYKEAGSLREKKILLDQLDAAKSRSERAERSAHDTIGRAERTVGDLESTWKRRLSSVAATLTEVAAILRNARWPAAREDVEHLATVVGECDAVTATPPFNFRVQEERATTRLQLIDEIARLLRDAQRAQQHYDAAAARNEERRGDFERADSARMEAAGGLRRARVTLTEELRTWVEHCNWIDVPPTLLEQVDELVAQYKEGQDDPRHVLRGLRGAVLEQRRAYSRAADDAREHARTLRRSAEEKHSELGEWRVLDRHVAPEPRPGQDAFRKALVEVGVVAEPLYAACTVAENVGQAAIARLEEALLAAGLLDAVIVRGEDINTVRRLAADGPAGWADRWITPGPVSDTSLLDYLTPASSVLDANDVRAALGSINTATNARFDVSGIWQLGPLAGRAQNAGRAEPRFIGESNRRRAWEERLRELEDEYERLSSEVKAAENAATEAANVFNAVESDIAVLDTLAAWTTLQAAALKLADRLGLLEVAEGRMNDAGADAERLRSAWQERLRAARIAAAEIPDAAGLELASVENMRGHTADARRLFRALARDMEHLEIDRARIPQALQVLSEARTAHAEMEAIRDEAARQANEAHAEYNSLRLALERQGLDELLQQEGNLERRMAEIPKEIEPLSRDVGSLAERDAGLEVRVQDIEVSLRDHAVAVGDAEAKLGQALSAYPTLSAVKEVFDVRGPSEVARDLLRAREADDFSEMRRRIMAQRSDARTALLRLWNADGRATLATYGPQEGEAEDGDVFLITFHSVMNEPGRHTLNSLVTVLERVRDEHRIMVLEKEDELYKEFLFGDITVAIRTAIEEAMVSHRHINDLLTTRPISDGWVLSLKWGEKRAGDRRTKGTAGADYAEIVKLLKLEPAALRPDQMRTVKEFLQAEVMRIRKDEQEGRSEKTFVEALEEVLDYRRWFTYSIWVSERGEPAYELNTARYGKTSGAEKALAVFLPLLAAADARYRNARPDAPKLLGMDEGFNGVDPANTHEAWSFMTDLGFSWIITSEKLWGVGPSLRGCSTYQFIKRDNVAVVSFYLWDGAQQIRDGSLPGEDTPDGDESLVVLA